MLTGHPPFEADTPEELAAKRLNEKPPLLRELNPDLTRKTEEVVNKMLNKSILLRYRDYDALLVDLKEAKTEATAKRLGVDLHPEFQPPPPPPRAPRQTSPLPLVITTVIVVLLIVGVVAYIFWPRTATHHLLAPRPLRRFRQRNRQQHRHRPKPKPVARPYNVEFSLNASSAPAARTITIAGDFNNWKPETAIPMRKQAQWRVGRHHPTPGGTALYKLIVDGKWIPDPENQCKKTTIMG